MNPNSNKSSSDSAASGGPTNQLAWQAFLYVAGEMTAEESQQFEARLEQDQVARQAVVKAMSTCQLIDSALAQDSESAAPATSLVGRRPVQDKRSLRPAVMAALAACLLVMVGINFASHWNDASDQQALVGNTDSHQVQAETTDAPAPIVDLAEVWADSGWDSTLAVSENSSNFDDEINLAVLDSECDANWMVATMDDIEAESRSVQN